MEKIYYGENENQFGELRLPVGNGPHPVAIVIHGGFWREPYLESTAKLAHSLTDAGFATWNIEYRRVGQADVAWPGTLLDVAKAADHLSILAETHPLQLEKVVTIGHSAGGHLALWLAGRHRLPADSELACTDEPLPISGAVSLAGVNDLQLMYEVHNYRDQTLGQEANNPVSELLLGSPEEQPARYKQASPIELLPLDVPQVLIHGSLDINVPIGISDHYHRTAENAGDFVKFVELPEAEHFKLIDTSDTAWETILEEMNLLIVSE